MLDLFITDLLYINVSFIFKSNLVMVNYIWLAVFNGYNTILEVFYFVELVFLILISTNYLIFSVMAKNSMFYIFNDSNLTNTPTNKFLNLLLPIITYKELLLYKITHNRK